MSNSFSVKFIIKKYKARNGEAPIYIRISHNGKNCDTYLKRKVLIEKWNHRQRVSGTSQEVTKLNRYLDKIYNKAFQIFEQFTIEDKPISAQIIRNAVFNINELDTQITLLYLSKYHFENANHKLKWGTLKHYQVTERYFERFLRTRFNLSDIPLKKVDFKFLIDFEDFLRNWEPKDHQKPMNNNGVMKHMIRFRKLLKLAQRLDWIEKNPFISYQTHFEKVERDFLDANELKAIEEKEFSLNRLDMVRDIFIFSCYTGLSYVDLYHLCKEDISIGMDSERWIHLKRIKTNTPFSVMLLPKAEQIIEKYRNHPRVFENQLLPVFSNQKTNAYLKEIAILCGVKKKLTFHIARHTFATTVTLTNGVPIETVSKMLGHTKLATTQIYAKVVENKIGTDMAYKGRVWTRKNGNIEELISWCNFIGDKLLDETIDPNNILRGAIYPHTVAQRPELMPISVEWNDEIYKKNEQSVSILGNEIYYPLDSIELKLHNPSETGDISILLTSGKFQSIFKLEISDGNFAFVNVMNPCFIQLGSTTHSISEYFYSFSPIIRFVNGAWLEGNQFVDFEFKGSAYERNRIKSWDWDGVNIQEESQGEHKATGNIQHKVITELLAKNFDIIFDDDSSGEAADIITITVDDIAQKISVELHHLKYSHGENAGARISDLYEVCGQAQKSVFWKGKGGFELFKHMIHRESRRVSNGKNSRFEKGTIEKLALIKEKSKRFYKTDFKIYIVQPGLSANKASDQQLELLAVTENHLLLYN